MDGHVSRQRPLDLLPPSRRFVLRPAEAHEVERLVEAAAEDIPAMKVIAPAIERVFSFNRETILAVIGSKGLVGGFAFLYLNQLGLERLLEGALSVADPDLRYLASQGEAPKALYAWAMYLPGRVVGAMGNVMQFVQRPGFADADMYARPGTLKGASFMDRTGFVPVSQGPSELFVYRRRNPSHPSPVHRQLAGLSQAVAGNMRSADVDQPRVARRMEVRVARGSDDLLMVYAIRAAVFLAEQDCPYSEEFDGNDHCATHFLGFVNGEPACCLRARYFGDFVKLERLAVRKQFRKTRVSFDVVRTAVDHVRRKGFRRIYGHAREGLEKFWAHFGAKPLAPGRDFVFSDYKYTEMFAEYESSADAITLDSGPYVIVRPEGDWDRPGVLESSAERAVRQPGTNTVRQLRPAVA
ncbi:Predicted N-acyltransferase, GNAT family [Rhizobiales bacterium GAS191]|jgi:predicted GNAT family N-acyltransferase|nr:Predicted N-acyltransferase, GNAT family [Rhizobiales bacterium GAS191]